MSQTGPPPTGERWNLNMPAVIGVVFVFLCAVVVWVIVSSSDGDDADETTATTVASATTDATPTSLAAVEPTAPTTATTTPAPMPSTSVSATTAPPTTAPPTIAPTTVPPTTIPPTTAAGADPDAVKGDLGIAGRPMRQPTCNGGYITVLASAIGDQASADSIAAVLDTYPDSNYLRTDQTCPSLRPAAGGEAIYVVFLGPFALDIDACTARSEGPPDAYARRLSEDLGPDHTVDCS